MMHLHGGRGGGLNLRWGCSGRWPRSLSRSGRGEVRLLLARVQHHRRRGGSSSGRRAVLLYWVHGGGRAGVLEVMLARVVMVVEVGGWMEMGQLVVMVRVMRCHCRGATVIRSHHFRGIGSRRSAKSHSLTQQPEMRGGKTKQRGERDGEWGCQDVKLSFDCHRAKRWIKSKHKCPAYIEMSVKRSHTNYSPALIWPTSQDLSR